MDCSSNLGCCTGGFYDSAFEWLTTHYLMSEESYPYSTSCTCKYEESKAFTNIKVSGYVDVTPNSVAALQAAVAMQPISVVIEADSLTF